MVEVAYVGSQGRQMLLKGDPNQAPPVVGVTDANRTVRSSTLAPALRTIGQVQAEGTLDYNGLLLKFQRRFANNFSFMNCVHLGKAIDLNSDNDGEVTLTNVYDLDYNRGPADYDITPHVRVELDLRDAVGARAAATAAGSSAASCTCAAACR